MFNENLRYLSRISNWIKQNKCIIHIQNMHKIYLSKLNKLNFDVFIRMDTTSNKEVLLGYRWKLK